MKINFIQGIVTYPASNGQQVFLSKTGTNVSFQAANGHTDVTFAYGTQNYLHTESTDVPNAWGPLAPNTNYWLFWDLDLRSAARTFGFTSVMPVVSGGPPTGVQGLHWFDTTNKKMFMYDLGGWRPVLRVFAAMVSNNDFTPMGSGNPPNPFGGSQVGSFGQEVDAGRIIVDNVGAPIRRLSGAFFTTEDDFFVNGSPVNSIRLEANVLTGTALESMAKFQIVKYSEFGKLALASYNDIGSAAISVLMEDLIVGETGTVVMQGVVTNPAWSWNTAGAPLWINNVGELIEFDPSVTSPLAFAIGHVPVARVLTPTSVYFDQGLGGKGEAGTGGGAAGLPGRELDPIMFPNLISDSLLEPIPDYQAQPGISRLTSGAFLPTASSPTGLSIGVGYQIDASVTNGGSYAPIIVVGVATFGELVQQLQTQFNDQFGNNRIIVSLVTQAEWVSSAAVIKFVTATMGANDYVSVKSGGNPYYTASLIQTLNNNSSVYNNYALAEYGTAAAHWAGADAIAIYYVDEHYIIPATGTPVGEWAGMNNNSIVTFSVDDKWKTVGTLSDLINKRVGIAMDVEDRGTNDRPSGSFAGHKNEIGVWSGSAWTFTPPNVDEWLTVLGRSDNLDDGAGLDAYHYGKRYMFNTISVAASVGIYFTGKYNQPLKFSTRAKFLSTSANVPNSNVNLILDIDGVQHSILIGPTTTIGDFYRALVIGVAALPVVVLVEISNVTADNSTNVIMIRSTSDQIVSMTIASDPNGTDFPTRIGQNGYVSFQTYRSSTGAYTYSLWVDVGQLAPYVRVTSMASLETDNSLIPTFYLGGDYPYRQTQYLVNQSFIERSGPVCGPPIDVAEIVTMNSMLGYETIGGFVKGPIAMVGDSLVAAYIKQQPYKGKIDIFDPMFMPRIDFGTNPAATPYGLTARVSEKLSYLYGGGGDIAFYAVYAPSYNMVKFFAPVNSEAIRYTKGANGVKFGKDSNMNHTAIGLFNETAGTPAWSSIVLPQVLIDPNQYSRTVGFNPRIGHFNKTGLVPNTVYTLTIMANSVMYTLNLNFSVNYYNLSTYTGLIAAISGELYNISAAGLASMRVSWNFGCELTLSSVQNGPTQQLSFQGGTLFDKLQSIYAISGQSISMIAVPGTITNTDVPGTELRDMVWNVPVVPGDYAAASSY